MIWRDTDTPLLRQSRVRVARNSTPVRPRGPNVPAMKMPAVNPPEKPGASKESLSVKQKEDLLAFLRRL